MELFEFFMNFCQAFLIMSHKIKFISTGDDRCCYQEIRRLSYLLFIKMGIPKRLLAKSFEKKSFLDHQHFFCDTTIIWKVLQKFISSPRMPWRWDISSLWFFFFRPEIEIRGIFFMFWDFNQRIYLILCTEQSFICKGLDY